MYKKHNKSKREAYKTFNITAVDSLPVNFALCRRICRSTGTQKAFRCMSEMFCKINNTIGCLIIALSTLVWGWVHEKHIDKYKFFGLPPGGGYVAISLKNEINAFIVFNGSYRW
jgi:hypothetical protein